MSSHRWIEEFLAQKKLALLGASRKGGGFGNTIWKELRAKGYEIFPVHPEAKSLDGRPCWPNLGELPEEVGGVIMVIPPPETEKAARDVVQAGIKRVWMQQGSESQEAIRTCEEAGVKVISGECILMFAEPTAFFHRVHRTIWRLLGRLPR